MSLPFLKRGFFQKTSFLTRILLRFFSFFLIYLFVVLFFSCTCGNKIPNAGGNTAGGGTDSAGGGVDSGGGGTDSGGGGTDSGGGGTDSGGGGTATPPTLSNWSKIPTSGAWETRYGHQALVFKDKIWVLGGHDKNNNLVDGDDRVLNSENGTNWQKVAPVGGIWAPRGPFQALVFDNKIWVLGGLTARLSGTTSTRLRGYEDIWNTSDGSNWNQITPTGAWSTGSSLGTAYHQVILFDSKLWLLAKRLDNQILWSDDGIDWKRPNVIGNYWSARVFHRAAAFDGKMWVVGGSDEDVLARETRNFKDVWSSPDGTNWTEHPVANTDWKGRKDFEMVSFNNKLWVFGGERTREEDGSQATPFVYYDDIWSTTDGGNWQKITLNNSWPAREAFQVVEFKGQMWILGGVSSSGSFDDIWVTSGN